LWLSLSHSSQASFVCLPSPSLNQVKITKSLKLFAILGGFDFCLV
jgi:hypothetical protein